MYKERRLIRLLYYLPMERMEKRTDFYDFIEKIQRQDRYIAELEEENKKLKEKIELLDNENMCLNAETKDREEENRKLKETIKDHQLYEEKLEHRIIEFEELLHWE